LTRHHRFRNVEPASQICCTAGFVPLLVPFCVLSPGSRLSFSVISLFSDQSPCISYTKFGSGYAVLELPFLIFFPFSSLIVGLLPRVIEADTVSLWLGMCRFRFWESPPLPPPPSYLRVDFLFPVLFSVTLNGKFSNLNFPRFSVAGSFLPLPEPAALPFRSPVSDAWNTPTFFSKIFLFFF